MIYEKIQTEMDSLNYSVNSLKNYRNIFNIEELGKIQKLYRNILSRHKSRAKELLHEIDSYSNSKLPTFVWDYFYPDSIFRTFMSWKGRGRCVKKGEKSFRRNDQGEAVFEYSQTNVPDWVYRNRTKLMEKIYSANDDAPYDESEYDAYKKFITVNRTPNSKWPNSEWDGYVDAAHFIPLTVTEYIDPYAYEPPFEYSKGYSG